MLFNLFSSFLHRAIALCLILFVIAVTAHADEPWKGYFHDNAAQATLVMDLYEESISAPGMDMLGPTNGYLSGAGIYGTWVITSFKMKDAQKAFIRLSNDLGSETQSAELTLQGDTLLLFQQTGRQLLRKAEGRKLVKVASQFEMRRRK